MPVLPEPTIIPPDTDNPEFWFTDQLTTLFQAANYLSLTSREGAIANNDKAGNLAANYVVFTSNGVANTEDTVPHPLGYTPHGYIVVKQDKAGIIYDGVTPFTTANIFLKSSVASVTWTLLVF